MANKSAEKKKNAQSHEKIVVKVINRANFLKKIMAAPHKNREDPIVVAPDDIIDTPMSGLL